MSGVNDLNVMGDFINRDQVNITYILKMPAYQPPANLRELRQAYVQHILRCYRALDFKGIPQFTTISHELFLEDVYVPLLARAAIPEGETWKRLWHAGRPLDPDMLPQDADLVIKPASIEEVLAKKNRMVVLGDPGSGKSTLLKHLALTLADAASAPLPILLPLNAYASALDKNGVDCCLQTFLGGYFGGYGVELANLAPLFDSAIAQGQALILLDGLDEVQSEQRLHLIQRVESFAAAAVGRGCRVVVTSRIVGYRDSPLAAHDWAMYTLLDFNREDIDGFAQRWCRAFERSVLGDTPEAETAAERERQALLEAVDANPGVARLASNPLLLTILALIKRQGTSLPNRRVELYEVYLKTLINAWNKARSLDQRPVGPGLDYLQTVSVLGPLALWLREENPSAGLVSEEKLLMWLQDFIRREWEYKPNEAMQKARSFLKGVRHYSNLLLERGRGQYGFIHLTFEEALAARGLVQKGQLDLQESLSLVRRHVEDAGWRETILLAVGLWGLVREEPLKAGEVVRAILTMECSPENTCRNLLLAGACLEDVGEAGLGKAAAREVRAALLAACRKRSLPPEVQRDAGFSLGRSGWAPDDLDEFVVIPAGEFLYGDEKRKVVIPESFELARYPVTNRQYRRFVEDGGYQHKEFWSDEGWRWRSGEWESYAEESLKNRLEELRPAEKRGEPFFWHDPKWNNPLAPVVGVNWFEAEAYCNWLGARSGRQIRLPDEVCWERAARGVDGKIYPWGDEFDRRCMNNAEYWSGKDEFSDFDEWEKWLESDSFRKASTTIVAQFPQGDSRDGLSDMAGNVWEWSASSYDEHRKILCGESWYFNHRDARCAYRIGGVSDNFGNNVGFRIFSPGSAAC